MSTSPFAPYQNATLKFQVASGELVPDRNGNLRPGKAVIEVQALLNQKRDPNREPRPGVDTSAVWVEGFITKVSTGSSLVLPDSITPDSPCAIVWQGRPGKFDLEFTARNAYVAALNIDLVEKIRGYFQPGSFAVAGDPVMPGGGTQYTDPLVASASLSALRIVATNDANQLVYASFDNTAQAFRVIGLLLQSVTPGQSVRVLNGGKVADTSWNWQRGLPIFLGLNGVLTQTPPEVGFLLQVATVIQPNQIQFEIQEPIFL